MNEDTTLINAEEVGRLLGLNARTIRRWASMGTIPGVVRMGGLKRPLLRFNKKTILRFIERREEG